MLKNQRFRSIEISVYTIGIPRNIGYAVSPVTMNPQEVANMNKKYIVRLTKVRRVWILLRTDVNGLEGVVIKREPTS